MKIISNAQNGGGTGFKVKKYTHNYSIAAGGYDTWNVSTDIASDPVSGYEAIGIVGYATNSDLVVPLNLTIDSIYLKNATGGTLTQTFVYYVLFAKTGSVPIIT